MKILDSSLLSTLSAELQTLAWCWRLVRPDNQVLRFTNFDLDLSIATDGIYKAKTGFTPSAISTNESLSPNNITLDSYLSDESISENDLLGGKYDYSRVQIFLVNYLDLPNSLTLNPPKHLLLQSGIIGEILLDNRGFSAEIRGIEQLLQNKIGNLTSKTCRATFGGYGCNKNLTSLTHTETIANVTNNQIFSISGNYKKGYFDYGRLDFLSGNNVNFSYDIAYYDAVNLILFQQPPFPVAVGDSVTVIAGCPKTMLACQIFNNTINFQGEPHVPLADKYLGAN